MKRAMDVGDGVWAAICALVLGACGSPPAAEPRAPSVSVAAPTVTPPGSTWTVVDLMPGWWRAAGESASAGPAERRASFRRHLVDAHPEAFTEEVLSLDRTAPMYQALWAEGLAVHVARALNPRATNQQLVLNDDMVRRGEAMLPALAREFGANLDSTDPAFYRDWFRGAGKRQDIPIRVGYFLGMRVAEVLGRTRTPQELAMLRDPTLRQEIGRALETLASADAAAHATPSSPGG